MVILVRISPIMPAYIWYLSSNRLLNKNAHPMALRLYFSFSINSKGRIPLPNQMNFWKSAKGGGCHFQSKYLYCRFWELFEHEINTKEWFQCFLSNFIEKNQNKTHFEEFGFFPENSSNLAVPSFPQSSLTTSQRAVTEGLTKQDDDRTWVR